MTKVDKQIQELMTEWAEKHRSRGYVNFISDGIINVEKYEQITPKICFFLKEAYSREDEGGWCLTEWLNNGAMTRMWGTVAEWSYGIQQTTKDNIPLKPQLSQDDKSALLRTISVINVKKSNGNVQSNYEDLQRYASEDLELLKMELDILNPDVIVCGNNSSLLRMICGATLLSDGKVSKDGDIDSEFLYKHGFGIDGDRIIIDYYHPANQYPSKLNYYTVCSLYQQALKYKG